MEQAGITARQPRRKFLTGLFSAVAGLTAALAFSKKTRAQEGRFPAVDTGPILYRRTEEAERYYRTLYR